MTAAAFKACYSDWKLIRTRKVVQIVFEVPLEAADEAYRVVGGMPTSEAETWFGIAKLKPRKDGDATEGHDRSRTPTPDTSPRVEPDPPRGASFIDMLPVKQAGILCSDPVFWRFLKERHTLAGQAGPTNDLEAAEFVRRICQVASRRDILAGTPANNRWNFLLSSFLAWKRAPEVVNV